MYKCEECNLIISELLNECPKCKSDNTLKAHDINEKVIYQLSVEDYKDALYLLDNEEKGCIEEIDEETILNSLKKDLCIPYTEYIVEHLRSRFIDKI